MALELDGPEHALRPALQREVDLMRIRAAATDIFPSAAPTKIVPLRGLFSAITRTADGEKRRRRRRGKREG